MLNQAKLEAPFIAELQRALSGRMKALKAASFPQPGRNLPRQLPCCECISSSLKCISGAFRYAQQWPVPAFFAPLCPTTTTFKADSDVHMRLTIGNADSSEAAQRENGSVLSLSRIRVVVAVPNLNSIFQRQVIFTPFG